MQLNLKFLICLIHLNELCIFQYKIEHKVCNNFHYNCSNFYLAPQIFLKQQQSCFDDREDSLTQKLILYAKMMLVLFFLLC